jgi:hypothetical protein
MPPDSLLRPLALDIISFLMPLWIGLGAFFVGRHFNRWSTVVRIGLVGLTVALIFAVIALLFHALPRPVEMAFSYAGGVVIVLCWMILGVIGYSWSSPNPSSDIFARFFLALMPTALIAVEAGGSLLFRFGYTEPWYNRPTEAARMTQRTKMTCLPAAASMLMFKYDYVDISKDDCCEYSEGELAYLAKTSLFGTDGHVMARVLTQKINNPGVSVAMRKYTYEEMVARGTPFVAEVQLEQVGKHSVLVTVIKQHHLQWIDPLNGNPHDVHPSTFEKVWTGNAIVIDGKDPKEN